MNGRKPGTASAADTAARRTRRNDVMPIARESDAQAPPSKSQRKREHHALQALATELCELAESRLLRIELDDATRQDIRLARSMKASSARNRQLRHIARQLQQYDPQLLRSRLAALTQRDHEQVAREQQATRLRERVLEHGEAVLELPLEADERTRLAQLRLAALAGTDGTRTRHARREIYRLILQGLARD